MASTILDFYETLAENYHLIFADWDKSIERQAKILNGLIAKYTGRTSVDLLDCACGIGTQAIGFAQAGHRVVASDLSRAAVDRAQREARLRDLDISFFVSDMTSLAEIARNDFDVVVALDNALPHLTPSQLRTAMQVVGSKLEPNGLFIASIRDYDKLILQRPTIQGPEFCGENGERRIVHQVWDWIDEERYTVHLYITRQSGGDWVAHHFATEYRCLLRDELTSALNSAGFEQVHWLTPAESGSYQSIVIGRRGERRAAARERQ
ncbi:MAG: class I SAM-dependent methyltransferase [Terracidiphilus sp.]|jgi:SAM-dependent methyltransferase